MSFPCPDEETWLALYAGELDPAQTERAAAHLEDCPRCQEDFDRLCRLGAGLRGALAELPRPRALRRRPAPPRVPGAGSKILGLVAASLLVGAVGLALRPRPEAPPPAAALARVREAPSAAPLPVPARPPLPAAPREPERPPEDFSRPSFAVPSAPSSPPAPPPAQAAAEPAAEPPAPVRTEAGVSKVLAPSAVIATFERAGASLPLQDGQGAKGRGVVRFGDGTRMDLSEKTWVARISDRGGTSGAGKWVELAEGTLTIDAAHQPPGRAMVIATPHGEARVVGTTLHLSVEPGSTRLDVLEGKVRLSRPGAAWADVISGHFAVAAEGVELAARPLPKMLVDPVLRFGFEDGRLPKAFSAGTVERGPERAGSRFSLAGVQESGSTAGGRVALVEPQPGKGLFTYSEDLVLSFDYWADETVRTLDLLVWSRAQQISFGTTVWDTPRERWVHLAVPLRDFGGGGLDRPIHFRPGESVPTLWIQAGQPGGKLYIDNFELARIYGPPGKAKEARR